jgi:hypothetical protein
MTNHTKIPKATSNRKIVILLTMRRKKVAAVQPNDMFITLALEVVALLNPRSVIPNSINTATERGSKTPSAKKLNPKYPVI